MALLATAAFLALALRYAHYLLDDAYISLRYARNWAEGVGLVFNAGERVEGYTNLLWVAMAAVLLRLDLDPMLGWKAISALSTLVLLWVVWRFERRVAPRGPFPAVLWLLPLNLFAYWATTGMETMFFTALATTALWRRLGAPASRVDVPALLAFCLLGLTRPEGALLFALTELALLAAPRLAGASTAWKTRLLEGAGFGLVYGGYLLWRYAYYGAWVPNTAAAKVTGGGEQIAAGMLSFGKWLAAAPLLVLALLLLPLFARRARGGETTAFVVSFVALGYVLYAIAIGGDFMPFHRFFLPVLPLAALQLSWLPAALAELPERLRPRRWPRGALWALAWVLHVGVSLLSEEPYRAYVAHRTTEVGFAVGRHFAARLEPGEWIAVNTAGSLPYACDCPTIDMLGLTDRAIAHHPVYVISRSWAAHRRGWGDYVLGRRPRFVVWYNTGGSEEPHYLGDHQLAANPLFRFLYLLRRVSLPPPEREPDERLAVLGGAPFGRQPPVARLPELGMRAEVESAPILHSDVLAEPVALRYFELRRDHRELWPAARDGAAPIEDVLQSAALVWGRELAVAPPINPRGRAAVEAACAAALAAVETGALDRAREILSAAAARNGDDSRAPCVPQYVANLAAMSGDLFLAIQAQAEAMRLEPGNLLYRRNLASLLQVSQESFRDRRTVAR